MDKQDLGDIIIGVINYTYIDGDKYIAECDKRVIQKAIDILRYYWQFETTKRGDNH